MILGKDSTGINNKLLDKQEEICKILINTNKLLEEKSTLQNIALHSIALSLEKLVEMKAKRLELQLRNK